VSWILGGVGCVLLLALLLILRMIETTYIRLGRARAAGLDEVDHADGRLVPITHDRESTLGPATLLRVTCQVTLVAVVAVVAANRWSALGVIASAAVAMMVLFVVGEAIPRRWALETNDRLARVLFRPVSILATFAPLRWLAAPAHALARLVGPRHGAVQSSEVAGDELVAMAEAAAEASLLDDGEAHLIGSIIELGATIVREVMVPRPDMITLASDFTIADGLRLVVDSGYTRLPVVGDSVDDVLGIVLAKDLVSAQLDGVDDSLDDRTGGRVAGLVRDAFFVPETKRVVELMREMQAAKFHLAVVVDEYGGTAGLVSLEDIIEELVGEIVDEFDDEVSLVEQLDDGGLLLAGRLPVDELSDLLAIDVPVGDWDTVGGLVFDLLGRVPDPGESVHYEGWLFSAREVEGRRISLVGVQRAELAESVDAADESGHAHQESL
jgi:putative hemolysin